MTFTTSLKIIEIYKYFYELKRPNDIKYRTVEISPYIDPIIFWSHNGEYFLTGHDLKHKPVKRLIPLPSHKKSKYYQSMVDIRNLNNLVSTVIWLINKPNFYVSSGKNMHLPNLICFDTFQKYESKRIKLYHPNTLKFNPDMSKTCFLANIFKIWIHSKKFNLLLDKNDLVLKNEPYKEIWIHYPPLEKPSPELIKNLTNSFYQGLKLC